LKILLVRHGKTVAPRDWSGDAFLRPLSDRGRGQAEAICQRLAGEPLARILSGPALACQQTVEPLTIETGIPVDVDERLDTGETPQRFLELFPSFDSGTFLFCTHREHIETLLRLFELPDVEVDGEIPCKKGSIWILEGPGPTPVTARYLEPVVSPDANGGQARIVLSGSEPEVPRTLRAAVLDLGSTSFNLLIADAEPGGKIRPIVREKVMLRLGAVIATSAEIPREICDRAVEVARELRIVAEQEKVQGLIPVATAALRDASNGRTLADRIGRTLGTPVRILSGEEEARLIFRAFQHRVQPGDERVLAVDLGGGSLEIARGAAGKVDLELTLPLGVARLQRELGSSDPLQKSEAKAIRKRVRALLAPHRDAILDRKIKRVIAAGGAVRALARLHLEARASRRKQARRGPAQLPVSSLRKLTDRLVSARRKQRLAMRGMRRDRVDLLPAGGIILTTLARELGIESLTVSDWGLREGVLLEEVERRASST
jgi:exopolyphosphatase/guanosine-5'-triphosphate,3'-diphosphate pyrophosphatase